MNSDSVSKTLYRKWRPQKWEEMIGQDHIVQTLRNAISANRVVHAYLFAGPRGTGKTTTARLLAKAVNCLEVELSLRPCNHCEHCLAVNKGRFLDLIEIDAASNTSVEDVRDLREKINYTPNQGRYKVYIIDEVHMLSTAAFNALLKTLEEPPPHAIFILATTEVHKIPATVMSRCQRHEFRRLPMNDIVGFLKTIAEGEGIQVEPEALTLVARQSTGAMRDAISLLDQLASSGNMVTLEKAQEILGTAASRAVIDVVQALVEKQTGGGLDSIHQALDAGSDPRQFARQIVDYLRGLLLIKMDNAKHVEVTSELRTQMEAHAQKFSHEKLLGVIRAFNTAAVEVRGNWQPYLPLEMAFIEAIEGRSMEASTTSVTGPLDEQIITSSATFQTAPSAGQKERTADARGGAVQLLGATAPNNPISPVEPSFPTTNEGEIPPPEDKVMPSSTTSSDQTFQRIVDNWRQMVNAVRQYNHSTQALLNSCKPMGMKDGVLFLSCSGTFVKEKMESGSNLEVTRKVFAQVLGMDVPMRFIVSTSGSGGLPPDVEGDGMVAAALRDLGGEIVDIQ